MNEQLKPGPENQGLSPEKLSALQRRDQAERELIAAERAYNQAKRDLDEAYKGLDDAGVTHEEHIAYMATVWNDISLDEEGNLVEESPDPQVLLSDLKEARLDLLQAEKRPLQGLSLLAYVNAFNEFSRQKGRCSMAEISKEEINQAIAEAEREFE